MAELNVEIGMHAIVAQSQLQHSASDVNFEGIEAIINEMRYCNVIAIEIISGLNPLQTINDHS